MPSSPTTQIRPARPSDTASSEGGFFADGEADSGAKPTARLGMVRVSPLSATMTSTRAVMPGSSRPSGFRVETTTV